MAARAPEALHAMTDRLSMASRETRVLAVALASAGALIVLHDASGTSVAGWPSPIVAVFVLTAVTALAWIDPAPSLDRHTTSIAAAVCSLPVFFALRTNWLNTDGHMLTPKFEHDVPLLGAHLTHDELLELYVHSRVWHYTHEWWGWSVVFSYQVVSCVAGAAFVYVLLRLSRRLAAERTWLFLLGALSGAYMQLFFGDAENYTIAAVLMAGYVLAALRFIAGETPLWVPAAVLAVAMAFHLEAAWLLPSAVYLCAVSRRRSGDSQEVVAGGAAAAALLAAIAVYFNFAGLPLRRFFSSHAGQALRLNDVFTIGMPSSYFVDQGRLLLLLCPAILLVVPAGLWAVRRGDESTKFLTLAAASMLLLQVLWKSQIGVFEDWNLYATGGLLASLLMWRYAAAHAQSRPLRIAAAAVAALSALHTYSWILANHRYGQ
jgi:hypothetical protein